MPIVTGAILAGVGLVVTAIFAYNFTTLRHEWSFLLAPSDTKNFSGGFTAEVTNKSRTEFHQIGFEINKMAIGMKKILQELEDSTKIITKVSDDQAEESSRLSNTFTHFGDTMQSFQSGAENQLASLQSASAMIQTMIRGVREMDEKIASTLQISEEARLLLNKVMKQYLSTEQKMNHLEIAIMESAQKIALVAEDVNNVSKKFLR